MPVSIRDDYAPGTRNGNTCSCCSAGRREVRDVGGVRKELIVDLGVSIDMEGWLMICESCVREAAGLLGLVEPTVADALRARLDQVNAQAAEQRMELAEAHQLIGLLREYDDRRDVPAATTALGMPEPAAVRLLQTPVTIIDDDSFDAAGIEAAKAIHPSNFDSDDYPEWTPDEPDPEPQEQQYPAAATPPAVHDAGAPAFQYRRGPGRPRNSR